MSLTNSLSLCGALLCSSFLFATQSKSVERAERSSGTISLSAGDHQLTELIRLSSENCGKVYVIPDSMKSFVERRITLSSGASFTAQEFTKFFETTLLDMNFALSPLQGIDGNSFRLVDLQGSNAQERETLIRSATFVSSDQISKYEGRAMLLNAVFTLKFSHPARLSPNLRQMTNPLIEMLITDDVGRIGIRAFPSKLLAIAETIQRMDVPVSEETKQGIADAGLPARISSLERRVIELEKKIYSDK